MGGMQALEWAITYPDEIKCCIPIATTAQLSPQALAFNTVGREAIMSDPAWNQGNYNEEQFPKHGLAIARMIGHITYHSKESMNLKFGRRLQEKSEYGYNFSPDFQLENYLKYQGDKFVSRFDPNSYLFLSKAMSYFDLGKKYGSIEAAFKRCKSKFLVLSITSDWLYPKEQSKDIVKTLMKLNKEVSYCEIESSFGHDSFLMDNPQMSKIIQLYLETL